jgi:cysteine desulfurase
MNMSKTVSGTVYFDNAATTPLLPCAFERLQTLSRDVMGNSASMHKRGRQAQEVLDQCHESLGRQFNVPPTHVIFTSGGTESNNLATWGALGGLTQAVNWIKSGNPGKLLTSTIEHSASSKVFESLECMGAQVRWIDVTQEGLLDFDALEKELSEGRTRLISVHHAQNEIGAVQDIKALSQLVRTKSPDTIIHIDAIQSYAKIPVDLEQLGVDMVSLSAHKIGGPKGVGALVLGRRFENRNPKIGPLIQGSAQQFGIRPGTVPVPAIGSFIAAAEWGAKNLETNRKQLLALRERLTSQLPKQAVMNGPKDASASNPRRAPQTVSFSIPGLPSAVSVEELSSRGFCVSSGAACHSTNPKPNETLTAMGVDRTLALSMLRVSFSSDNTIEEVDAFVRELNSVIEQLC